MGLMASNQGGGNSNPVPEGMHNAICYLVTDLGTQFNETFSTYQHKVLIGWELTDLRMDLEKDGETRNLPRVVSSQYSLSLHEKSKLRKDLVAWRGKEFTPQEEMGFDISKLLGVNCQLQVVHKTKKAGGKFAAVNMVLPPKDGRPAKMETENDHVYYSIEEHGKVIPDDVYPWVRDIISQSEEFKELAQLGEEDAHADYMGTDANVPLDAYDDEPPPF